MLPWRPSYSEDEAREAISASGTWAEVMDRLGLARHGKNVATLRRWARRWGIDFSHLRTGRTGARHNYTEGEAREAIAASRSWAESLRRLGYCHTGANPRTLKRRAAEWGIPTDHFDPDAARAEALRDRPRRPLAEILVAGSTYSRQNLKRRLYEAGLKRPVCELCGQGEVWRGKSMSMIIDHVNGVRDDNRLENLRIVCPNCAATLDTHCGRKNRVSIEDRECRRCGRPFSPNVPSQRYCSRECGMRWVGR